MVYSAKPDATTQKIEKFLATTNQLSASFKQTSFNEMNEPGQVSYGKLLLKKPGMFRWDYEKPYVQQIISKEGKVWFYDADLEQVTIKSIDQSLDTSPALLLSGEIKLTEKFTVGSPSQRDGLQWVNLVPKDENSSYKSIRLGLDDSKLKGMRLSDNFGQVTEVTFSDLKVNQPIDDSLFIFVAPQGVDVFEDK
ncbi:MAG: outer membrane lipoprotein chaperone LolA [Methylococcaceae bacterium]